jgi:hypothetical protein
MITARGAFVVQVDDAADPATGRLDGRVEHLVSGRSAAFDSGSALLAFIASARRLSAKPTRSEGVDPEAVPYPRGPSRPAGLDRRGVPSPRRRRGRRATRR